MKHLLLSTALVFVFAFMLSSSVKAQGGGYIYGTATVTINYSSQRVEALSTATADYTAGLNFNPAILGELYRTDNPETDLDTRYVVGSASVAARVSLSTGNFVPGKTYCNYSTYFAIRRSTGYRYTIGNMQDCKTIAFQSTPTPTPTATPFPTFTPTPTPTPTPSAQINSVGFGGNFPMQRYVDKTLITNPTWERASATNARNPVAYKKGTETALMKLSADFTISPPPQSGQNLTMKARVKLSERVIAVTPTAVSVNGSTVSIQDLSLSDAIEPTPMVKKGVYSFDWEVSFDDGQTWQAAGTSSDHIIYWTYDNPKGVACTVVLDCIFVNGQGQIPFPGLFDKALDKAIGELSVPGLPIPQSPEAIAKTLAANIDRQLIYNPGTGTGEDQHPLDLYDIYHEGECSQNANLLLGLLRSAGIDAKTIYVWGGHPNTPEFTGGTAYWYRHLLAVNGRYSYVTFGVDRPSNDGNPKNPSFSFHAMVKLDGGSYFDPSYGQKLLSKSDYPFSTIVFKKVVDLTNPASPKFKKGNATIPFVVKGLRLNLCDPTSAGCPHTDQYAADSFRPAVSFPTSMFNDNRTTDLAFWRPSEGNWYIKHSDGTTNGAQWGQSGDKIVPGDYDGDGTTDFAVFRPSQSTWYVYQSESDSLLSIQWGVSTDIPVSGDFDGDGQTDFAVFRPSDTTWYILRSSDEDVSRTQFGISTDIPVPGDYDGDGKTDIAVWRPSNGDWYTLKSSDGSFTSFQFGVSEDIPVAGDYDNDRVTDYAVFRPSTGVWHVQESFAGYTGVQFGNSGDVPVPGDYDGDHKNDFAVWTPSSGRWRILNSADNTVREDYWGAQSSGDIPVPSAFNR